MRQWNNNKKCALCGCNNAPPVKAHIIAKGFFEHCANKKSYIMVGADGATKRRQDALFLNGATCEGCEKRVFTLLDNYALSVLRDKKDAIVEVSNCDLKLITYMNLNRKLMRAYLASLLWRMDRARLCNVDEMGNVDIGDYYRERISNDLLTLNDSAFNYVDFMLIFLTDDIHQAFDIPHKMEIRLDGEVANGYKIEFPNMLMFVSLDERKHPFCFGKNFSFLNGASLSLDDLYNGKHYAAFQKDKVAWLQDRLWDDCFHHLIHCRNDKCSICNNL